MVALWEQDVVADERRAKEAIAATIQFEAVKSHWRQTKEGCALTLNLNPAEMPPEVALANIGQRFLCVLVPIGHDEQPVNLGKPRDGAAIVQRAGILCQSVDFQDWLCRQGLADTISQEDAAQAVRDFCGVGSRADLATNTEAARKFRYLSDCYTNGKLP